MANPTQFTSTIRETIVGDGLGSTGAAGAQGARIEILVGDRVGLELKAEAYAGQVRETIVGDGVGASNPAGVLSAVREVLIGEAPFKLAVAYREVLVSMLNEDLSVHRLAKGYAQTVAMMRLGLPDPATVRSPLFVPSLRQQIVLPASRQWARSEEFAQTFRQQSTVRRNFTEAPAVRSTIRANTYHMLTVQSRGNAYVPSSGVFMKGYKHQTVQARVVRSAPAMWSTITLTSLAHMTVLSRIESQVPVITTDAFVNSLAAQVVMSTSRLAPFSRVDAMTLRRMVVQRRDVTPPGIDDRVASYRQQVAIARVPAPPFGAVDVKALRLLSVAANVLPAPRSQVGVSGMHELTVLHRFTYAPGFALGRHVFSLVQQSVQAYARPAPHSPISVGSIRLGFVLGRTTVPPIDVIDPTVGRHAYTLSMLTVQHRETTPPDTIGKDSRFVHGLFAQVALRDQFDAPPIPEPEPSETLAYRVSEVVLLRDAGEWAPVSAVSVPAVFAAVALGDDAGWSDPTIPVSVVQADGVMQSVAVGDVFPGSDVSQSDAMVAGVQAALVVGDSTMPDPAIPLSEILVDGVAEFAAVGDAQWIDPTIPLSDVLAQRVASFLALRDPSLAGVVGGSEIMSPSVMQFYVTRDPTMKGVALRSGPRPIISVTIS